MPSPQALAIPLARAGLRREGSPESTVPVPLSTRCLCAGWVGHAIAIRCPWCRSPGAGPPLPTSCPEQSPEPVSGLCGLEGPPFPCRQAPLESRGGNFNGAGGEGGLLPGSGASPQPGCTCPREATPAPARMPACSASHLRMGSQGAPPGPGCGPRADPQAAPAPTSRLWQRLCLLSRLPSAVGQRRSELRQRVPPSRPARREGDLPT